MNVVIVELVAKAKAINKYLGSNYKVLASYGHVRDLPSKDGSVEPDKDFADALGRGRQVRKVMKEIAEAVKKADKLILATDPDREGEAISWHILRILEDKKALKKGVPVERVTFNAVTKQSVLDAFKAPREIDAPLVEAYLARRALDYLVGFTLSPVLWRKLPGARSAGRVQSVALRLVCDREAEIEAFKTEEYWTIEALLATAKGEEVRARLTAIAGKQARQARHQGRGHRQRHQGRHRGRRLHASPRSRRRRCGATPTRPSPPRPCSRRPRASSASPPSRPCRWPSASTRASSIDGEVTGLITYMRTDGVTIIPEAIAAIRELVEQRLLASATCRPSSASTRPRPRTRRRRTRRSARPTCGASPRTSRATWSATRPASTS